MIEAGAVKFMVNMFESQNDGVTTSAVDALNGMVKHGTISHPT
jgi:hypothetical protein